MKSTWENLGFFDTILQLLLQWSVFDLVCAQLVEILFNGGNYLEKMAA